MYIKYAIVKTNVKGIGSGDCLFFSNTHTHTHKQQFFLDAFYFQGNYGSSGVIRILNTDLNLNVGKSTLSRLSHIFDCIPLSHTKIKLKYLNISKLTYQMYMEKHFNKWKSKEDFTTNSD